ncbi:hypothetical protein NE684_10285, partial [Pseudoflavonifractor phocaeensis]|nr:hypothetical protein [Pseudoflavonifractor phocaeensis]
VWPWPGTIPGRRARSPAPLVAGKVLSWALIVFMICNMAVSCLALARYNTRAAGQVAGSAWEAYMDEHYGDAKMERIYPNAIQTD